MPLTSLCPAKRKGKQKVSVGSLWLLTATAVYTARLTFSKVPTAWIRYFPWPVTVRQLSAVARGLCHHVILSVCQYTVTRRHSETSTCEVSEFQCMENKWALVVSRAALRDENKEQVIAYIKADNYGPTISSNISRIFHIEKKLDLIFTVDLGPTLTWKRCC